MKRAGYLLEQQVSELLLDGAAKNEIDCSALDRAGIHVLSAPFPLVLTDYVRMNGGSSKTFGWLLECRSADEEPVWILAMPNGVLRLDGSRFVTTGIYRDDRWPWDKNSLAPALRVVNAANNDLLLLGFEPNPKIWSVHPTLHTWAKNRAEPI